MDGQGNERKKGEKEINIESWRVRENQKGRVKDTFLDGQIGRQTKQNKCNNKKREAV